MRTVAIALVLLLLTAWLWLVSVLATPEPPDLVWTVEPATTTAPLSEVVRPPAANILDVWMFGCLSTSDRGGAVLLTVIKRSGMPCCAL